MMKFSLSLTVLQTAIWSTYGRNKYETIDWSNQIQYSHLSSKVMSDKNLKYSLGQQTRRTSLT